MGELSKKVGKRIKQIREAKGLKQCALAEKLNMEPSNLTRIESGYQFPKEENLSKIASILEVNIKDLFDFSENQTRKDLMHKITYTLDDFNLLEMEFIYNFIKMYQITR